MMQNSKNKRQVILDTETTGLDPKSGHRVIEIGCVEMIDRRLTGNNLHFYFNIDRQIDAGAVAIHGITSEFLEDKPKFYEKADEIMSFLNNAEVLIHNAPFDVGFLEAEFARLPEKSAFHKAKLSRYTKIIDTLVIAKKMHPRQRNSLDALCKRYKIDNTHRTLHGALLDSQILAQVYLAMTGGQISLFGKDNKNNKANKLLSKEVKEDFNLSKLDLSKLKIIELSDNMKKDHKNYVKNL